MLPIPHLDQHVITTSQNIGKCLVNVDSTNEIIVGLPLSNLRMETHQNTYFVSSVIVIYAHIQVVTPKDHPLLSSNKTATTYRLIARFKVVTNFLLFCIIHYHFSRKKTQENPRLSRVIIDTFYAITFL